MEFKYKIVQIRLEDRKNSVRVERIGAKGTKTLARWVKGEDEFALPGSWLKEQEAYLNLLGQKGWELVHLETDPDVATFYLRKQMGAAKQKKKKTDSGGENITDLIMKKTIGTTLKI